MARSAILAVTTLILLTSCAGTMDGIWLSGPLRDVTEQDIRQAIAACSGGGYVPKVKPRQIDVISRNEIHVYWFSHKTVNATYDIAKRVRGRWTCDESVLVVG